MAVLKRQIELVIFVQQVGALGVAARAGLVAATAVDVHPDVLLQFSGVLQPSRSSTTV